MSIGFYGEPLFSVPGDSSGPGRGSRLGRGHRCGRCELLGGRGGAPRDALGRRGWFRGASWVGFVWDRVGGEGEKAEKGQGRQHVPK